MRHTSIDAAPPQRNGSYYRAQQQLGWRTLPRSSKSKVAKANYTDLPRANCDYRSGTADTLASPPFPARTLPLLRQRSSSSREPRPLPPPSTSPNRASLPASLKGAPPRACRRLDASNGVAASVRRGGPSLWLFPVLLFFVREEEAVTAIRKELTSTQVNRHVGA